MSENATSQMVLNSRLIEKFEIHRDFTRLFLDAFVLINREKKVLKFNQMFCSVVALRAIQVRRSESLDDIIQTRVMGNESGSRSPVDILMQSKGPQRIDEIEGIRVHNAEPMRLIMSSYSYYDDDGVYLGSCILMRDVTAESQLQSKYQEKSLESITDSLTGLYMRRYFEDYIDREIERCHSQNQIPSLAILMFDLDKFKSINDTYGHQAGDFVLQETAKILKESSRRSDILGRYGGEELLVLLSDTSEKGCCIAAEKFRENIEKHKFIFDNQVIPVSSSVGISMFLDMQDTREKVVARADECLYSAKKGGRNVVYANFGGENIRASDILQGCSLIPPLTEKSG